MARTKRTKHGRYEIVRFPNARGLALNLADEEQPVILVTGPGIFQMIGRWSTLCIAGGAAVNALDATDEQIVEALVNDESIYA